MNFKFATGLLVIFVALLGGGYYLSQKTAPSASVKPDAEVKAVIGTATYDWGTIGINNGDVEATFEIKNEGTAPLKLLNTSTSCACTEAQFTYEGATSSLYGMHTTSNDILEVSPGKTATLKAIYDPLFHGPSGTGPITRQVFVETNDPASPTLTFTLLAEVVEDVAEEVTISPQAQDLATVIYGDVAEATFSLVNNTQQVVNVTRVTTSCGCTTAKLDSEKLSAGSRTNISVAFDPAFHKDDTDLGDLTRTVFIETDHPEFAKLTADITANVIKK